MSTRNDEKKMSTSEYKFSVPGEQFHGRLRLGLVDGHTGRHGALLNEGSRTRLHVLLRVQRVSLGHVVLGKLENEPGNSTQLINLQALMLNDTYDKPGPASRAPRRAAAARTS